MDRFSVQAEIKVTFHCITGQKSLFLTPKERRRSSDSKQHRQPIQIYLNAHRKSHPCLQGNTGNGQTSEMSSAKDTSSDMGILVRENTRTVKVDNTLYNRASKIKKLKHKSKSDTVKNEQDKRNCQRRESADGACRNRGLSPVSCFKGLQLHDDGQFIDVQNTTEPKHLNETEASTSGSSNIWNTSASYRYSARNVITSGEYYQKRSDSVISTCSALSECQSTFSASDITLNIGTSRDNSLQRPRSAPSNIVRNSSSGSLPNMIINNFVASSSDNFRSLGSWRFVIDYKGKWESKYPISQCVVVISQLVKI